MNFNKMSTEKLTQLVTQLGNIIENEKRQGINVDILQNILDEVVTALRAKLQ